LFTDANLVYKSNDNSSSDLYDQQMDYYLAAKKGNKSSSYPKFIMMRNQITDLFIKWAKIIHNGALYIPSSPLHDNKKGNAPLVISRKKIAQN
jgi:hypothetical protein